MDDEYDYDHTFNFTIKTYLGLTTRVSYEAIGLSQTYFINYSTYAPKDIQASNSLPASQSA